MTERLSDADLQRLEALATAAHDYGGDEQELGELASALLAEVRASREREAVPDNRVTFMLGELRGRVLGRLTVTGYGEMVLVDEVVELIEEMARAVGGSDDPE